MLRRALPLVLALLMLVPFWLEAQDKTASDSTEQAPAGTWKVLLPLVGQDDSSQPRWLIKLQNKDGKWAGEVLATAQRWPKVTLEKLTVTASQARFILKGSTLTLTCEIKLAKDSTNKLFGSAILRNRPTPIELERTNLSDLDPFEQARELLNKQPLGYESVQMALSLLGRSEDRKLPAKEIRAMAEKAIRSAGLYGPGWQRDVLLMVAEVLAEQKGAEAIVLEYARRAESQLEDQEPATTRKRVLGVLAAALEKAGKTDEAKKIKAQVEKLDFRIKPRQYAGRKGKSDRVVLAELFTNANSETCVAAELGFDALGRTFSGKQLILLQYHLHTKDLPDPLVSPDAEGRVAYYEAATRGALPAALFDGRAAVPGGGRSEEAQEKYDQYADLVENMLEETSHASLNVTAKRKGEKIEISVEVSKLNEASEDVRLRLALVEPEVTYKSQSGQTVFHHVVRAMPGGYNGTVLKDKKPTTRTFTVDLAEVRKQLQAALDKAGEKKAFPSKDRPLELKNLKVVAYVQNDNGGVVMQAVQADVVGQ